MRSVTRAFLIAVVALSVTTQTAHSNALDEILRTAALKNGLRPSAQLFNNRDAALAASGKLFFESKHLSLNGKIACRTCHLGGFGSADGLPNAVGIFGKDGGPKRGLSNGKIVPRNTLSLWGRGAKGFETFFWDGKIDFSMGKKISQFGDQAPSDDSLITAVHLPPAEIREMLNDDPTVSLFKRESPQKASELYDQIVKSLRVKEAQAVSALAGKLEKSSAVIQFHDIARSIAAFIRGKFRLKDTRFHKFVFGSEKLTTDEVQGGIIFYGKGRCVNCHNGPHFSNLQFHAIPFPQLGFGKPEFGVDYGRFNVTFQAEDLYKFRTPPLFNVEKTAPYGHSGSLSNLHQAIVAHFDPLRSIDPKSMTPSARHEFFKRMAAVGESFKFLTVLNDEEVEKLQKCLLSLSFD
jgi:cytochrome c peroxidase